MKKVNSLKQIHLLGIKLPELSNSVNEMVTKKSLGL
jgi:hypothetical protein